MAKDAATPAPAAARPFHYFRLVPAAENGRLDGSSRTITIEQSRRQQLARRAASSAEDTMRAVDTVRAFDRTGNISDALPHLIASAEATLANARALAADIKRAAPSGDDFAPSAAADMTGGGIGNMARLDVSGLTCVGVDVTDAVVLPRPDQSVTPAVLAQAAFKRHVGLNRG